MNKESEGKIKCEILQNLMKESSQVIDRNVEICFIKLGEKHPMCLDLKDYSQKMRILHQRLNELC